MKQGPPATQFTPLQESWSPPDSGFNQRAYSDDEIEPGVINIENLTQQESEGELDIYPFIDDKGVETHISQRFFDVTLFLLSAIHPVENIITRRTIKSTQGQSTSTTEKPKRSHETIPNKETNGESKMGEETRFFCDYMSTENLFDRN